MNADDCVPRHRLHLAHAPRVERGAQSTVSLQPIDALLLAWLALEGPTSRPRLAQLFWPEVTVPQGRNSLRQRLFRLRRQVGELVRADEELVALSDDVAARAVQDLNAAGELLREVQVEHDTELHAWLAVQRARLRDQVDGVLAGRCDEATRLRDWPVALALAQELLTRRPLSEDAHCRVIELHYLSGDRAAALMAFDRCERVLKEEIGARPSPRTLQLLHAVEGSGSDVALPLAQAYAPVTLLRPPRMVGREAERRLLAQAWRERRVAIVIGEGGVGKSRLIEELCAAQPGAMASGARPGDERVSYATASRMLRRLPPGAMSTIAPLSRTYLACLLPELGTPAALDGEDDRLRLFNACVQAIGQAQAAAPEAFAGVALDDLQFADRASLDLIGYLVGAIEGPWVLASRPPEPGTAAFDWIATLRQDPRSDVLSLQPLSRADVEALLDSLHLPATLEALDAERLSRRTGGNPLFVLEAIKAALADGGAPSVHALPAVQDVRGLIGQRIQRLSPDAVQLARCAALAGADFSISVAAQVLGKRTLELADPWAELEAAQILVDGVFAHDLILEAARASVPAPVARELHAEIASHLGTKGGEPARVAHHWEQALRWPEAGRAYRAAARRAGELGHTPAQAALLADAARCFERGHCVDERVDALIDQVSVLSDQMLIAPARLALEQARDLATTDAQSLRVLCAQAELVSHASDLQTAIDLAEQGLPAARQAGREDLQLRFAAAAAMALAEQRRAAEGVALLQPYTAMAQRQPDPELRWSHWRSLALCLDYAGRLREALPAWDASCDVAVQQRRIDWQWQSISSAAATWSKLGQLHRAVAMYDQAERLAREVGTAAPRLLLMTTVRAHRLRDLGDYASALPLLEEALAEFTRREMTAECAAAEHRLAQLYQQLGQPERAMRLLAVARPNLPPGLRLMRLVHQADVAGELGRDGLPQLREALALLPSPDDVYHRVAVLFATRWVPPDEGEAQALSLATWASAHERLGLALAAHVRAAACALAQQSPRRAAPHADAALHLATEYRPDSFYLPELWLVAAQASLGMDRADQARAQLVQGNRWVDERLERDVPPSFRESFAHRNPVNRELRVLASRLG